MTTSELLRSGWELEPTIAVGCLALAVAYASVAGKRPSRAAALFALGLLVLFVALTSPLDELGDQVLLSAHMLQHLALVVVAVPLGVAGLAGLPEAPLRRLLALRPVAACEAALHRGPVAWTLGVGLVWLWHAPSLYDAALQSEAIHVVEHLCFLVGATIFWWPVLCPLRDRRLAPLTAIVYLFSAAIAFSLLGVLLTFSPLSTYPFYLAPTAEPALLHLVRESWGISPLFDHQLAGMLMWLASGPVFLGLILVKLADFYRSDAVAALATPGEVAIP